MDDFMNLICPNSPSVSFLFLYIPHNFLIFATCFPSPPSVSFFSFISYTKKLTKSCGKEANSDSAEANKNQIKLVISVSSIKKEKKIPRNLLLLVSVSASGDA